MTGIEFQSAAEAINSYRECARCTWNGFFQKQFEKTQDWALVDSFKLVKEELFRSIVLLPILGEIPSEFQLGVPSSTVKIRFKNMSATPVMVNRTKGDIHGYWDHPITTLDSTVDLLFVDLFDWNSYGFLDMSLVLAVISGYEKNPHVVGHSLIVDIRYAEVVIGHEGASESN